MWTRAFWRGLGERAIKTFFQTLVATVTTAAVGNTVGVTDVDWLTALSITSLATLLSVATSIGNTDFTAGTNVEAGGPVGRSDGL